MHFTPLRLAAIVILCAGAMIAAALPARAASPGPQAWRVPGLEGSGTTTSGTPYALLPAGDRFVYLGKAGDGALLLWASDGTATGTEVIRELCHGCELDASASTGTVVFLVVTGRAGEPRLWRSDGTSAGTYPLPSPLAGTASTLVVGSESAYALACDSQCSLTMSDGTVAGTRVLAGDTLDPLLMNHYLVSLAGWNDEAYLVTRDRSARAGALWRLSARSGTVERVRDFPGGPHCAAAVPSIGRLLVDLEPNGDSGQDLWVSDGTTAGTSKLRHFSGVGICDFADRGGRGWFVADESGTGSQLWSTDGTAAGTLRATNFGSATPSSAPSHLAMVGSRLLFVVFDAYPYEPRLWTTDGRSESAQPITGCPGGCPDITELQPFAPLGDRVAFIASRNSEPPAMWITDGTGPGTVKVHEFPPTQYPVAWVTTLGDRWYLRAPTPGAYGYWEGGFSLWASDGTPAGTVALASMLDVYGARGLERVVVALGGHVFFSGCAGEDCGLLVTEGRTAQAVRTLTLESGSVMGEVLGRGGRNVLLLDRHDNFWLASPWYAEALDESVTGRFSTCNAYDVEATPTRRRTFVVSWYRCTVSWADNYWSTDGTVEGTRAVALQDSTVQTTASWGDGNSVLYLSYSFEHGASLGISDGTRRGTKRIVKLPAHSYPSYLVTHGGVAIFVLYADGGRPQLWSSDGTRSGTRALSSFHEIDRPVVLGNRVYALASRAYEEAPVLVVVDLARLSVEEVDLGPLGITVANALTAAADRVWLAARSTGDGVPPEWSLWVSDGTTAGTQRLTEMTPLYPWGGFGMPLVTALGSNAYFTSFDAEHGRELWRSDGTAAGTTPVIDLAPGVAAGAPQSNLVVWKGRLYFAADDGAHGAELWSTDGTAAGTSLALEIAGGPAGSSPAYLTIAGDRLYFAASDGQTGRQLWVMDRPTP